MLVSTLLPVIAVALGAANAAILDNTVVEPRAPKCRQGIELLELGGINGNPSAVFTGVSIPSKCEPLPRNIKTFEPAKAKALADNFKCTIYTLKDCDPSASDLTVGDNNKAFKGRREWKSWKCCACKKCKPGKW